VCDWLNGAGCGGLLTLAVFAAGLGVWGQGWSQYAEYSQHQLAAAATRCCAGPCFFSCAAHSSVEFGWATGGE
jgi:hypothetical protein